MPLVCEHSGANRIGEASPLSKLLAIILPSYFLDLFPYPYSDNYSIRFFQRDFTREGAFRTQSMNSDPVTKSGQYFP